MEDVRVICTYEVGSIAFSSLGQAVGISKKNINAPAMGTFASRVLSHEISVALELHPVELPPARSSEEAGKSKKPSLHSSSSV
jgi:hypothetical protein